MENYVSAPAVTKIGLGSISMSNSGMTVSNQITFIVALFKVKISLFLTNAAVTENEYYLLNLIFCICFI